MTNRDEKMQVIIDLAKKQVVNWYNPITNREWISQSIGNNIPKFSNRPEERTEMYVLTGGEAKGFVVAFHGLGKVIAYDMYATRTREYSIRDNQKYRNSVKPIEVMKDSSNNARASPQLI